MWIHGSGAVDRDGKPSNYIQQFREAINKKNIAFFSYGKRTANPKNTPFFEDGIYLNDFVLDAQEVVNYFKKNNQFSSIILLGPSQDSLVAMKALENANKFISLAGTGEPINKTLIRQLSAQNPALGTIAKNHFKELKETGEIKDVNPNLLSIFAKPNQAFWLSWMQLNPVKEIEKIKKPTLILNGDKDFQVLISDAENLKIAKPNASFKIIKNMNHVLKNVTNKEDNYKSYTNPDFPISTELISVIVKFVNK